jgi:hypothetical protein
VAVAAEEQVRRVAGINAAAQSFPFFLRHCTIKSDDPLHPGVSEWQPWPYLTARAEMWASGQSEVVLKARQLGYTWLLAAYMDWRARNGWACGIVSKGEPEAYEVIERARFIEDNLPEWLQAGARFKSGTASYPHPQTGSYVAGGSLRAFATTPSSGISWTFQCVAFDEFAFHKWGADNYAAIEPTTSAGGQMLIMSTADPTIGPSGIFHDLYWASKAGATGYNAHFEPWYSRPTRDEEWRKRARARYTGLPEEFDAYYPDTDHAAFTAKSGLVFPQFSQLRHVRVAGVGLEHCTRIVAGVDFGGGDPTAVTILGLDKQQHVHQYSEFYKRGAVGVDELAGYLSRAIPAGHPATVVCDPSQGVAIETLNRSTPRHILVRAADNKRGEGLGMVAFLLENDRLSIDPSCKDSIAEFPGYRWANKTDPNDKTRYATTAAVDHHADAMDARRYAVLEITAMLHEGVTMPKRTMHGKPLARRAV